jgi:hypothetical protein
MSMINMRIDGTLPDLALGLVEVFEAQIGPADEGLARDSAQAVARVARDGAAGGEARRSAVRGLLRNGVFRPSGRSKPAQEYLLRCALEEGQLPPVFNAVDALNRISLTAGLPITLLSLARVQPPLVARLGRAGEKYVFNRAGQELDTRDLICICTTSPEDAEPVGSPVKDSMRAKIDEQDRHMLACIYAPRSAVTPEELLHWTNELGADLQRWCRAGRVETWVAPASW